MYKVIQPYYAYSYPNKDKTNTLPIPPFTSLVFIAPCLAINFMFLPICFLAAFIAVAHLVARFRVMVKGVCEDRNHTLWIRRWS